jgi:hypothetical protein
MFLNNLIKKRFLLKLATDVMLFLSNSNLEKCQPAPEI